MPYDEQGFFYPETNPILDALNAGQSLPALSSNATQADRDLYAAIQNPDNLPALINGNFWIGNAPNQNYPQGGVVGQSVYDALATGNIQDPNLQLYVQQLLNNASRHDVVDTSLGGIVSGILNTAPYVVPAAFGAAAALAPIAATAETGTAAAPAFTAVGSDFAPFAGTLGSAYGSDAALSFETSGLFGLTGTTEAVSGAETITSALPAGVTGQSYDPSLLEQLKALGNTPIFEGGPTYGQVYQGASLANSVSNVAQNPSGSGIGGLAGTLLGAYTGVPGLGIAGSLAGSVASGGGGTSVADTTSTALQNSDGSINWLALLPSLIGLAGGGVGLAGAIGTQGQAQSNYAQQQALYQLLLNLAGQNTANAAGFNAQLPTINAENQQLFQQLQQFAQRNLDPANVAAGAKAFQQQIPEDVLRGVQRDLAMRGQSDGGAANDATATVLARIAPSLQSQAIQQYLQSQQLGLSGLRNPANPLQPTSLTSGYPSVPSQSQIPGINSNTFGNATNSIASTIGNLVKLLAPSLQSSGSDVATADQARSAVDAFRPAYNTAGIGGDTLGTYELAPSSYDFSQYGDLLGSLSNG